MKQEVFFSKSVNTNDDFMIRMCPNYINHLHLKNKKHKHRQSQIDELH